MIISKVLSKAFTRFLHKRVLVWTSIRSSPYIGKVTHVGTEGFMLQRHIGIGKVIQFREVIKIKEMD